MSIKGALQSHSSLVFAVSEEKQVHEMMLRLILGRVNASSALCKWASTENNTGIKAVVEKFHELTLTWSNIQKQFAEQYLQFGKALDDILQVELGIDAIKKQSQDCTEKIEKLKKQLSSNRRKSDMVKVAAMEEELNKSIDFQGELAAELQAKSLKAELFKNTKFKGALLGIIKANLDNIASVFKIFTEASEHINKMPDIPAHLVVEETQPKTNTSGNMMAELEKELISRMHSQQGTLAKQKTKPGNIDIVAAGSPPSPMTSPVGETQVPLLPKRVESTKRPAAIRAQLGLLRDPSFKTQKSGRSKSDEYRRDLENMTMSNSKKESKMDVIKRKVAQRTTLGRQKNNQKRRAVLGETSTGTALSADEASSSDEFEEPGYVCPNDLEKKNRGKRSPQRRRRASTGTFPFESQDDYADPWDCYSTDWAAQTYDKYLEPYDAIPDAFSAKIKNEVCWQMSPLMPRTEKEEEEGIYDVIGEPAPKPEGVGDEDYIYDVILANPTESQDKGDDSNGKEGTVPPTPPQSPDQPAPYNSNTAAPQLPPRKLPLKPPKSPDLPIPGPRLMRVESEPAQLFAYDNSLQRGESVPTGKQIKIGSAPQRQVPNKPPRKMLTKQEMKDLGSKPPRLPPRKGEAAESVDEPDECPVYEPVNVNVKDMIAILQEKAVTMPQLVNPMLSSGKASPK